MKKKILIWMDPNISSEENVDYQKTLKKYIPESYFFDSVDKGIEQFKSIYFKDTIIILSCRLYDDFYNKFQDNLNNFYSLSKVYIFTSEYNNYLVNEGLYNYQKKVRCIEDLIDEITEPHFIEKSNPSQINFNSPYNINEIYECKEEDFSFDIINQLEDFILPIFFQNLITDYDYNEQKTFQKNVYDDYSTSEEIKDLFLPIFDYKIIPIQLLSKIYARLYTIESDFYFNLNSKLKEGYGKEYIPFIKCLYEGINKKTLTPFFSEKLYRGTNISKNEFDKLNNIFKTKQKDFPKIIVFSRAFLSFSKDKNTALGFINNSMINYYKILFEIEKTNSKLDISLCSNADIRKMSIYDEEEIIFFPGSTFEVKIIDDVNEIKKITLVYLGKYKKLIKKKYLHNNFFKLIKYDSKFYEFLQQKTKKEKEIKNEDLSLFNISLMEKKIRRSLIPDLDSKIIKTEKENLFIKKLISPAINITLKLLYRKSIDGDSFEAFHNKCDNINENIIFVKSKEGKKFGGYYPNHWESINEQLKYFCNDVKIFSIDRQKIFSYKTNIKYNIIKSKNFGPNFTGDFSFIIKDMNMCYSCGDDAFLNEKNLAYNKNDCFPVDEVEVFQIIYEDLEDEVTNGFSEEICLELDENIKTNKDYEQNINHFIKTVEPQNYILCYYQIKSCDLNKSIQLINFFSKIHMNENYKNKGIDNENEIKNNCEVYFKGKKIDFSYQFKEKDLYEIKILCKKPLKNINFMFSNCTSLSSIDFSHFNSDFIINTSYLFNKCYNLENIKFPYFNTSNVTNMSHMFGECESIKTLNLNHFNTINVTNMSEMFFCCYKLENLNIENFNTEKVTKMNHMFYQCTLLKNLNLLFKTDNVLDMSFMFFNCISLDNLTIKFNTKNCINMEYMFSKCSSLISIDLSHFNTLNVKNMKYMFNECESLNSLNLENFDIRNVKNMEYMFSNCKSLKFLILNFKLQPHINYNNIFLNINRKCRLIAKEQTILNYFYNNTNENLYN